MKEKLKKMKLAKNTWTIDKFNQYDHNFKGNLPQNMEIYLIRHGEGRHNEMKLSEKLVNMDARDALLTLEGFSQAQRACEQLKIYLKNQNKIVKFFFGATHLKRTQQTIAIVQKTLNIHQTIHIIPCAHETLYTSSGNCDDNIINVIGSIAKENQPICSEKHLLSNCFEIDKYCNDKISTCCRRQRSSMVTRLTAKGSWKSATPGSLKAMCPFSPKPIKQMSIGAEWSSAA